MTSLLIEHATILTVDCDRRILADGSILVDGGEIAQVGRSSEVHGARPPDRVIDGRSFVMPPGFVDTHVHLSEHLSRGLVPDDVPVNRYLPDWLLQGQPSRRRRDTGTLAPAERVEAP